MIDKVGLFSKCFSTSDAPASPPSNTNNGTKKDEAERSTDMEGGTGTYPVAFRTTMAFWILGLCNNYGYVVMLSAAVDIINSVPYHSDPSHSFDPNPRSCSEMSTGAVLLADIIPALIIKIIAPFFPLWVHVRMLLVLLFNVAGFVMVSQATSMTVALSGVVAIALASGLGEVTLLAYQSSYKNRSVISGWSSGTGGAGFFGSLSYMLLSYLSGPNKSDPLLIFLIVPTLMGISFFLILENPAIPANPEPLFNDAHESGRPTVTIASVNLVNERTLMEKFAAAPKVLKYMIPFALVYLFEYFINQGLHELIHFNLASLTFANQYVSYQLCYQIGVFMSRSSINLFRVHNTWLLAFLQGINVAIFATEAIYGYMPHIAIVWALIIWEGLLGGLSYVNTYDRINREVPVEDREFFMSLNSFGDSVGISLAGAIAIPVHNAICDMPVFSNH